MNRDERKEVRRALGRAQRTGLTAALRAADGHASDGKRHAFALTTESANYADDDISIAVVTYASHTLKGNPPSTFRAALIGEEKIIARQWLMVVEGDWPRFQDDEEYYSGDVVTHDNGGGLRRWEANTSVAPGSPFDLDDWDDIEAATGWQVGYVPHVVAIGTAGGNSSSPSFGAISVTLDNTDPAFSVTADNPGKVPVTSGDKVPVWLMGNDAIDANDAYILNSETASQVGEGGGGEGDGDELVASQSGQTAGYLSAVLVDSGAQTPPWYGVDVVLDGATMYGRVQVPEKARLVIGAVTADVTTGDATFTITGCRALSNGVAPVGNQTITDAIASYNSGDWAVGIRDETNSKWLDATFSKYTRVKCLANGAVDYAEDGFSVDNVELLEGCRQITGSLLGYGALRDYRNNEPMELVWNDTNGRFEDATPLQFRLISYLTKGAVAAGAASFTVDNVIALAGGANPTASAATELTVHDAVNAAADNALGYAAWNESAQEWQNFAPPSTAVAFARPSGAAIAHLASGTADIMTWNGSAFVDSTVNGTLHNYTGHSLANGKVVPVYPLDGGGYLALDNSTATVFSATASGASNAGNSYAAITASSLTGLNGEDNGLSVGAGKLNNPQQLEIANSDKLIIVGDYNGTAGEWAIVSVKSGETEVFDFILQYGQTLTAGSWNDGTRKWTDGGGSVTLLSDNEDGTYDEGSVQAVKWSPNVEISPPSGKAYRGRGRVRGGVYHVDWVYNCDGVTWTSGE